MLQECNKDVTESKGKLGEYQEDLGTRTRSAEGITP